MYRQAASLLKKDFIETRSKRSETIQCQCVQRCRSHLAAFEQHFFSMNLRVRGNQAGEMRVLYEMAGLDLQSLCAQSAHGET